MEYDVDLRGQQHGSSLVAIPATQAGAPPLYKAPSCASKAAPCEPLARVEPAAQREKTSCSRECGFQGLDEDLVLHETKCIRARLTKQNERLIEEARNEDGALRRKVKENVALEAGSCSDWDLFPRIALM